MPVVGTWRKSQDKGSMSHIRLTRERVSVVKRVPRNPKWTTRVFLLPSTVCWPLKGRYASYKCNQHIDDRWRWKAACACTIYVNSTRAYHVRVARFARPNGELAPRLGKKRKLICCQVCHILRRHPVTDQRLIEDIFCICLFRDFSKQKSSENFMNFD